MGSSSSFRAFGAILHRFSNVFSSKCLKSFGVQSNLSLSELLIHFLVLIIVGSALIYFVIQEIVW